MKRFFYMSLILMVLSSWTMICPALEWKYCIAESVVKNYESNGETKFYQFYLFHNEATKKFEGYINDKENLCWVEEVIEKGTKLLYNDAKYIFEYRFEENEYGF